MGFSGQKFLLLLFTACSPSFTESTSDVSTVTTPGNQLKKKSCPPLPKIGVVPGQGFDGLTYKDMAQVLEISYETCSTTSDGRYLIPDDAFLIPIQTSDVELYSEVMERYSDYKSLTTESMNLNVDGSFWGIKMSGSYSTGYETTKEHQVRDKSVRTLVNARYVLFRIGMPVTVKLHPHFKMLVNSAMNQVKEDDMPSANYIWQMIVENYGTHVQPVKAAGGIVAKEDFLTRQFTQQFQDNYRTVRASAAASFFGAFNFHGSYGHTEQTTNLDNYDKNTVHSQIHSYGGMLFKPNSTVDNWIDSIRDNPVTIDREGIPLQHVITPMAFPNASIHVLNRVVDGLAKTIRQYYEYNRIQGCMDFNAKNYDFNANIENGICEEAPNQYTFGGMYQTCSSLENDGVELCGTKDLYKVNQVTGSYSCPVNFAAAMLKSGVVSEPGRRCHEECERRWVFWKDCWDSCQDFTSRSRYSTFWCYPIDGTSKTGGVRFGGLYTSKVINPVTQANSCPPSFNAIAVLQVQISFNSTNYEFFSEDLHVCWGMDSDGNRFTIPFGGFFSCEQGNPLYGRLNGPETGTLGSKECTDGYVTHTATIDQDCLVSYCVKADSYRPHGRIPLIRPPFGNYSGMFDEPWSTFRLMAVVVPEKSVVELVGAGEFVGILVSIIVVFVLVAVVALYAVRKWKERRVRAEYRVQEESQSLI